MCGPFWPKPGQTLLFFFKQSLLNLLLLCMYSNLMSGISSPPVFSESWMQTGQGFPLLFKTCGDGTEKRTVFEIFYKEQNTAFFFFYFIAKLLSNKMNEMVQLVLISKCFLKVRKCHLTLLHCQSRRLGRCLACVWERLILGEKILKTLLFSLRRFLSSPIHTFQPIFLKAGVNINVNWGRSKSWYSREPLAIIWPKPIAKVLGQCCLCECYSTAVLPNPHLSSALNEKRKSLIMAS